MITTTARPATTVAAEVEGPPPSRRQLIGTWREVDGPTFVRFNRDGTFVVDTDKLDVPYYATGTYELAEDTIAFTSNGPDCADSWEWRVGIVKAGGRSEDELHIVFLDAGCNESARRGVYVRPNLGHAGDRPGHFGRHRQAPLSRRDRRSSGGRGFQPSQRRR